MILFVISKKAHVLPTGFSSSCGVAKQPPFHSA